MTQGVVVDIIPIGFVRTKAKQVPKFWTLSDVEGMLVIDEKYREGLRNIEPNQLIEVIFYFHKSEPFTPQFLTQYPRGDEKRAKRGVFSTRSPIRPNPIGISTLTVTAVKDNIVYVKGLDMVDGTPLLDIKPKKDDRDAQQNYK